MFAQSSTVITDPLLLLTHKDSVWCEIGLLNRDRLIAAVIYRSPTSTQEQNHSMESVIREVSDLNPSHLLVLGDFNMPEITWDTWDTNIENPDDYRNKFLECLRDCFLYQHVSKPTRVRNTDHPSILDLILTNEEGMVADLEYLSPLGKSDHEQI